MTTFRIYCKSFRSLQRLLRLSKIVSPKVEFKQRCFSQVGGQSNCMCHSDSLKDKTGERKFIQMIITTTLYLTASASMSDSAPA